ncbi:histidinol-phosphate transaminase [Armatimonas sp.]|uniref:histidinol-phosphate aminotransferase family protein n=1 Tax=Armatimonas sp. TaxID=1872638 RepID=UPI00286A3BBA|nr:histidinol-phosphate transaminase [Armatimonas sp.]
MTQLSLATPTQREEIYRLRHAIYAAELGQHAVNPEGRLTDALDEINEYLVATEDKSEGAILGFVSLTQPSVGRYSLDKYFERTALPFPVDEGLWEVRLLTVLPEKRQGALAMLLMQAALRHVAVAGGTRIVGIGRREIKSLYESSGLVFHGKTAVSGAVTYELMSASVEALTQRAFEIQPLLTRLLKRVHWNLPFDAWPQKARASCYHGGAFFGAIGADFSQLERRRSVINADVLDAWFDPAPAVQTALAEHLPWLLKTSPPTQCEGLVSAISVARGIPENNLVVGAGSSDLIFRAFSRWLSSESRVLLPDPVYGEYAHVLENVIGCDVERLPLCRTNGWRLDTGLLAEKLASGDYDLCVLVHPSNPTGNLMPRAELEAVLTEAHPRTRVWVDEAYIDYVGREHSLEPLLETLPSLFVCKSLSKVYALSGARVAYLGGAKSEIAELRRWTPPWAVSLPAQVAAVRALAEPDYYAACWNQTHVLRRELAQALARQLSGVCVEESVANWLTLYLPESTPTAQQLCELCSHRGIFLRDLSHTSTRFGSRAVRIAVKDHAINEKIVAMLAEILAKP